MKLSEAMRLGAMLKPQTHGQFRGPVDYAAVYGDVLRLRTLEGTCALGAVIDAGAVVPWFSMNVSDCPACDGFDGIVPYVVMHLNDWHDWTREQIADWVETVEPRDTEPLEEALATNAIDPVGEGDRCLSTRGSGS